MRYAVLADRTLAVLATDVDLAGAWSRSKAAIRRSPSRMATHERPQTLAKTASARAFVLGGSGWEGGARLPLETPFPLIDRFPDGSWLVAAARSEPGMANARRITGDGTVTARLVLGDGIEHVAIGAADRIWVGWFDEGVFGNEGWHVPGREWPPSADGLACFGADGTLLPELTWPGGVDSPADCYALNVQREEVWVCAYTDFALVRFGAGGRAHWWRNAESGPRALAVFGNTVLLAGGYGPHGDRLVRLELGAAGNGESARVSGRWRLPLRPSPAPTDSHRFAPPDLLTGRGDTLHLVDAGIWQWWRVAAVDRAAAAG